MSMEPSTLIISAAVLVLALAVSIVGMVALGRVSIRWSATGAIRKPGPDEGRVEDDEIAGLRREIGRLSRELTRSKAAGTEAELENHAKSDFLAVMSHELRTPLNSILGFAEMIECQMFGPLETERYAEYARDIRIGGEHLLGVVNDVLDLSRIGAGKMELKEEYFDLLTVMRDTIGLFEERAGAQGITMKVSLPQSLPALNADARMVKQMLINLLSNAIDFTPTGGWVVVAAEGDGKDGLSLVVADTGSGIAAEKIPHVLKPFHSFEGTSARTSRGIGLGLPLVKSMIELHGGEFLLNSTVGKGTTVSLTFPPSRVGIGNGTAIGGAA